MVITWLFGRPLSIELTGFQLDCFQFFYDCILALIPGLLVWRITHQLEMQEGIRRDFATEVQNLSRYLDALQELTEKYPARKCDLEIKQLIELSPRHCSFEYLDEGYEVVSELANEERSLQASIDGGMNDEETFKRHASNIFRIRNRILRLQLPQGHLKTQRSKHQADWAKRNSTPGSDTR